MVSSEIVLLYVTNKFASYSLLNSTIRCKLFRIPTEARMKKLTILGSRP